MKEASSSNLASSTVVSLHRQLHYVNIQQNQEAHDRDQIAGATEGLAGLM